MARETGQISFSETPSAQDAEERFQALRRSLQQSSSAPSSPIRPVKAEEIDLRFEDEPSPPSTRVSIGQHFKTRAAFEAACRAHGRLDDPNFEGVSVIEKTNQEDRDTLVFLCTGVKPFKRGRPLNTRGFCIWQIKAEMRYFDDDADRFEIVVSSFWPHANKLPEHTEHDCNSHNEHATHPHLGLRFEGMDDGGAFFEKLVKPDFATNLERFRWPGGGHTTNIACSARHKQNGYCNFQYDLDRNAFGEWVVWRVQPDHVDGCAGNPDETEKASNAEDDSSDSEVDSIEARNVRSSTRLAIQASVSSIAEPQTPKTPRTPRRFSKRAAPEKEDDVTEGDVQDQTESSTRRSSPVISPSKRSLPVDDQTQRASSKKPRGQQQSTTKSSLQFFVYLQEHCPKADVLDLASQLWDSGVTKTSLTGLSRLELSALLQDSQSKADRALLDMLAKKLDLPTKPPVLEEGLVATLLEQGIVACCLLALHPALLSPSVTAFIRDIKLDWDAFSDPRRLGERLANWAKLMAQHGSGLSVFEKTVLWHRLGLWHPHARRRPLPSLSSIMAREIGASTSHLTPRSTQDAEERFQALRRSLQQAAPAPGSSVRPTKREVIDLDSDDEPAPPPRRLLLHIGQRFTSRADFEKACRAYGRRNDPHFEGVSVIDRNKTKNRDFDTLLFICTGLNEFKRGAWSFQSGLYCTWQVRAQMRYIGGKADCCQITIDSFSPIADQFPKHSAHSCNTINAHAEHPHLGVRFVDSADAASFFRQLVKSKAIPGLAHINDKQVQHTVTVYCRGKVDRKESCPFRYSVELNAYGEWVVWYAQPDHADGCTGHPDHVEENGKIQMVAQPIEQQARQMHSSSTAVKPSDPNSSGDRSGRRSKRGREATEEIGLGGAQLAEEPQEAQDERKALHSFERAGMAVHKPAVSADLFASESPGKKARAQQSMARPLLELFVYLQEQCPKMDVLDITCQLWDDGITKSNLAGLSQLELSFLMQHKLEGALQKAGQALLAALLKSLDLPETPQALEMDFCRDLQETANVVCCLVSLHQALISPRVIAFIRDIKLDWPTFSNAKKLDERLAIWAELTAEHGGDLNLFEKTVLWYRIGVWRASLGAVEE